MKTDEQEVLWPLECIPRKQPDLAPERLQLTPNQMFVLSKIDGQTNLGDMVDATGLDEDETMAVLRHLVKQGLVIMDSADEAEPCDLDAEQRKMIDEFHQRLNTMDLFELLGVDLGVSQAALRQAFAEQAKRFHPDRYYGKKLGSYDLKLARIFQQINGAFEFLQDDARRAEYEPVVRRMRSAEAQEASFQEQKQRTLSKPKAVEERPTQPLSKTHTTPPDERNRRILEERIEEARRRRKRLYTRLSHRSERGWAFYQQALEKTRSGDTEGAYVSAQLAATYDSDQSQYVEMIQMLKLRVSEQRAADHARRAEFEEQAGRPSAAAQQWAKATQARPRALYHRHAAEQFLAANEYQSAAEHALSAIDLEPNNARAHLVLAEVYATIHRPDKARHEAEKALELDDQLTEARKLLGKLKGTRKP